MTPKENEEFSKLIDDLNSFLSNQKRKSEADNKTK